MHIESGRRFGAYEVVSPLGSGGMGEVYRARDSKLNRDVAIKVLPDLFAHDTERIARFTREAQALAALNHPNIAHIYGVIETPDSDVAGGQVHALVMELVEGEDLSERLTRGAIPLEEALAIARQIAEALEAAHEHGIVHRDLKPANIKVREDGTVKVLDFGLAKALDPGGTSSSPDLSNSPTLTVRGTQAGVILGTAAYMAPEQARGRAVDRRADIWAFGVVLYEMLTGRQLFSGETVSDVLAAVLTRDADLVALPAATPAAVRYLISRCLDRDPKSRLRDIGEARVALSVPSASASAARPSPGLPRRPTLTTRLLAASVGVLAVALALALAGWWRDERRDPPPIVRYDVPPPVGTAFSLTLRPAVSISRDGTTLVFAASGADGTSRLYLRKRDEVDSRPLAGTEGATGPEFSPDGKWVAFAAAGEVKKVSLDGTTTKVAGATDRTDERGFSWLDNDTLVASLEPASGLVRISTSETPPTPITTVDATKSERSHRWPMALPGGRAVLFTVGTLASPDNYDDCAIDAVIVATGERRRVLAGASFVRYIPTGHLLFARGGTVFAVPFDADHLAVTGRSVPVLRGVAGDVTTGAVHLSVADDGTLAYIPGSASGATSRLAWVAPDGKTVTPAGLPQGVYFDPELSPDGTRVALVKADGGVRDIWVYDFNRTTFTRLSFGDGANMTPSWSADGRFVYYASVTASGNQTRIMRCPADRSRDAEPVLTVLGLLHVEQVSRDGKWAVVTAMSGPPASSGDVERLELKEGAKPVPLVATPHDEYAASLSPDERWFAYQSNENGRYEVYVRDLSENGGRWQVSTSGGEEPRWAASGKELFFRRGTTLFAVPVTTAGRFSPGTPRPLIEGIYDLRSDTGISYDIDARTGRFLMLRTDSDERPVPGVRVILNWFQELRRMASGK